MILVAGGAGYIGSHVNKELYKCGYDTVVYDNLIYGHREAVKWGVFEYGDINDARRLEEVFSRYSIDAVLHFAAFAYVGESVENPGKYYRNNVSGTVNLLETMVRHNVKKIVFSSTCATYGEPDCVPITESQTQNPVNPYGKSKLFVEKILEDYKNAYDLNYVCLRYFNAAGADLDGEIGESHTPETHIIPLILDVASGRRDSIKIYGTDYDTPDGSCVRDYIHVKDLANAHISALKYLNIENESNVFNLGACKGTSVIELVDHAKKVTGKDMKAEYVFRRPGDPAILIGSFKKAESILKWKPLYSDIDTILKTAWMWHLNKKF